MSTIFGKALLAITRTHADGESPRYDVDTFIQRCTDGIYDRDAAQEEFTHLEYDVHPLPSAAYKLGWGDTVRVAVTFSISFHKYWDGECDSTLEYHKERVLRRQKYRPRYQTKEVVNFDMGRMQRALAGKLIVMPSFSEHRTELAARLAFRAWMGKQAQELQS